MEAIHILLVEDNEGDILLISEALEEWRTPHSLSIVRNGLEAIDYVFRKNGNAESPEPSLIFLDMNLPIRGGLEVLEIIKSDPSTRHIPVLMFSTSSSPADIRKAYAAQANAYVIKPVEINEFAEAISSIENFWLKTTRLPVKN